MEEQYTGLITDAIHLLRDGLLRDQETLVAAGRGLDGLVRNLLRQVGVGVMEGLYEELGAMLASEMEEPGFRVLRAPEVNFKTLFGVVRVSSPYLWSSGKRGARPLLEVFGVEGGGMSESVERALTDFGSEKSFARAAASFKEHYGWEVGRTTVLSRTERVAAEAEEFLDWQHSQAQEAYHQPLAERPGKESMLVELDGCEIRTGRVMTAAEAGRKDIDPDKVVRLEAWREVRTALARPLDEVEPSFACAMTSYSEICDQLFAVACERKLASSTEVIAVADGARGLMEELVAHFPNAQFVLDYPHLKSHLYETAEALGFESAFRKEWVRKNADRIWDGDVDEVIRDLTGLNDKTQCDRLDNLIGYLSRFRDAVNYSDYVDRGWPVGSGEVESAHRYVPQERLKLPGAWWRPDHVNPMLALRVVRANGHSDDFWHWRHKRCAHTKAA